MQTAAQKFVFHGSGIRLFALQIVNILLTIVSFGLYYPWARAAYFRFTLHETEFAGNRFSFSGTGWELFKGLAIGLLILAAIESGLLYLSSHSILLSSFLSFMVFMLFVPFVIHASMRYRTSRISWRGIHFGYRGDLKMLMNISVKGTLLTVVTLGVYSAWYAMEVRNYVLGNVRFGSIQIKYHGKGLDYFLINLKGIVLTIFTFGLYWFWWNRNLLNYYINKISLTQHNKTIFLKSTASGNGFSWLQITNLVIIIFTLGIATPWTTVRTLHYIFEHIELLGELDLENIHQTEEEYKNATGEDLMGMLDIGWV
ncbi:MAG TPA: DUF898 domain-containing protein [Cytophagales bacterium]|jgi:uncharacterized membrane protein YjgN (DUF898 family)|nr:DUF898 domain-containing protein [Cytophagales bacterium]